jgi:hypothetical protein
MRRRFVRREPEPKETLGAALLSGALAVGVGLVSFYFVRLLLARDEVGESRLPALPEPSADEE